MRMMVVVVMVVVGGDEGEARARVRARVVQAQPVIASIRLLGLLLPRGLEVHTRAVALVVVYERAEGVAGGAQALIPVAK